MASTVRNTTRRLLSTRLFPTNTTTSSSTITLTTTNLPSRRPYHSPTEPQTSPYRHPESTILSSALTFVPTHGFTQQALAHGIDAAGYPSISSNLFPRGALELVLYHLRMQRAGLKDKVQFPVVEVGKMGGGSGNEEGLEGRVRSLVLARLEGNVEAGVVERWEEAVGLLSLGENLGSAARELGLLSDEIWYLAGDTRVDGSWYVRRGALGAVYAAAELVQMRDGSVGRRETVEFVERRLREMWSLGEGVNGFGTWLGFQGGAMVDLLRSKGVRI